MFLIGGIIAAVAFVAATFFAGMDYSSTKCEAAKAKIEAKEATAQAKVDAQARQIEVESENKLIDMQASFDAGQAQAKTVKETIYLKGKEYVDHTPAFINPVCDVTPDGVRILNDQITDLRAAALAAFGLGAVPSSAANRGTDDRGRSILSLTGSDGPAPGVPSAVRQPAGASAVPSASPAPMPAGSRPKPVPIR